MMKPLLLLVFTALLSVSALGQEWRLAPTAGLNVSTLLYSRSLKNSLQSSSLDVSTGPVARPMLGAYIDRVFSDRFSLRSGLLYTGKGGVLKLTSTQYSGGSGRGRLLFSYLEVPLMVNVAIGENGLRLIGGAVAGLTVSGRTVTNANNSTGSVYNESAKLRIGNRSLDEVKPTDISLSVGIAKQFELADDLLELGLHVQPSLSHWTPDSPSNPDNFARNMVVGLRVSYLFKIGR